MLMSGITDNIKTTKKFTDMQMLQNDKAFDILISGLYSDKPGAIIREICSNAYDAHKAAGKEDVPFDITVPTKFNNTLIIRDYGTGLTADQVTFYFGTIFGSGSCTTNEAIGGFGLGAKSPFCLVDSYFISSYKDGEEHKFHFVRNAGGRPKLIHQSTTATEEENGIKFSIECDGLSINWLHVIAEQLSLFKVKPNVNKDIMWHDLVETDFGFRVVKGYSFNSAFVFASMGGVKYNITDNSILNTKELLELKALVKGNIVLDFDIGELDPAPNRESLQYTDKTLKALYNKIRSINFNSILRYIVGEIKASVKDGKGMLEPYTRLNRSYNFHPNKVTFRTLTNAEIKALDFEFFVKNNDKVGVDAYVKDSLNSCFKTYYYNNKKGNPAPVFKISKLSYSNLVTKIEYGITASDEQVYVLKDSNVKMSEVVEKAARQLGVRQSAIILVTPANNEKAIAFTKLYFEKNIKRIYGDDRKLHIASEMGIVRVKVPNVNKGNYSGIRTISGRDIAKSELDINEDEIVYVPFVRNEHYNTSYYTEYVHAGKIMGDKTLVRVTPSRLANLADKDNWTHFDDFMKDFYKQHGKSYSRIKGTSKVLSYTPADDVESFILSNLNRHERNLTDVFDKKIYDRAVVEAEEVKLKSKIKDFKFDNYFSNLKQSDPEVYAILKSLVDDTTPDLEEVRKIYNSL